MNQGDPTKRFDSVIRTRPEFSRRQLLAGVAGLTAFASQAFADEAKKDAEEKPFNSWTRTKTYKNGEMDSSEPWVAKKLGNFDLTKASEANLARIKVMNNLVGKRTYLPMVIRATAGRSEKPGALLYAGYALFTWQLQVLDEKELPGLPKGTAVQRAQYTCVYVDPVSMQPVKEHRNPLNGKMMPLADYLFVENFLWYPNGGVGFLEEPEMIDDDPNAEKMPHIRTLGDDVILSGDGVYRNPGKHQPRFTGVMWRAARSDIMDPKAAPGPAFYSHMGVNKAYEKPWTGHTVDEDVIIGTLANGKKVHSVDEIPETHKKLIVDRYPDRV